MTHSNIDEDLTPVKESSHFKLSPSEIIYLKQLPQDELLDKFIEINENFMTLKKYTRKQEDKIMRLQTKLRKLTSDLKGRNIGDKSESYRLMLIEHEEEVETLNSKISLLDMKTKNLEAKLRVANVQLCSAKKNRIPQMYRHITSRIDSGIRRSQKSKSLTNIHQAVENSSQIITPGSKKLLNKNNWFSHEREASILSTPERSNSVEMPNNQYRFILEEARNKIAELEEDQEQLLQQLSVAQQNAEDEERAFMNKITSLEKELEKKCEECKEKTSLEQKEKLALIRSERQNKSSNSRMSALSDHLKDLESKLFKETLLKEEALDVVDSLREEKQDQDNQIKKITFENDKLKDQIEEIKREATYMKKQLRQLELENGRLTELCVTKEKKQSKQSKSQNSSSEMNHRMMKTSTLLNEITEANMATSKGTGERENVFSEPSEDWEITTLLSELSKEREEKASLLKELSKEKEKFLKAQKEIKELQISNNDFLKALEKMKCEHSFLVSQNGLEDLKKSIEEDKEMEKGNIYDKMAFRELQNQYMELQLIYREKKMEFEKVSSLLGGHARTYEQLKEEKEAFKREIERQKNDSLNEINILRESIHTKEEIISRLEEQLLSIRRPMEIALNKDEDNDKHELGETLSLNKHHNVLELVFDKLNFTIPVDGGLKTFASWVMFVPLSEPLQHTGIAVGSPACFNHTSLYKFKMNYSNFFLIKDQVLKVDIYFLMSNDLPRKIGECVITLNELLSHPQNSLHGTVAVAKWDEVSIPKGEEESPFKKFEESTIGSLHYSIRFHKSGEQYIAKFRKKLAELANSQKQRIEMTNSIQNSDYQNPSANNSVNSTPKSVGHPPDITHIVEDQRFVKESLHPLIDVNKNENYNKSSEKASSNTQSTNRSSSTSVSGLKIIKPKEEEKKDSQDCILVSPLVLHQSSVSKNSVAGEASIKVKKHEGRRKESIDDEVIVRTRKGSKEVNKNESYLDDKSGMDESSDEAEIEKRLNKNESDLEDKHFKEESTDGSVILKEIGVGNWNTDRSDTEDKERMEQSADESEIRTKRKKKKSFDDDESGITDKVRIEEPIDEAEIIKERKENGNKDETNKKLKISLKLKDVFRSKKSSEEKSLDVQERKDKNKKQIFKSKKLGFLQMGKKQNVSSSSASTTLAESVPLDEGESSSDKKTNISKGERERNDMHGKDNEESESEGEEEDDSDDEDVDDDDDDDDDELADNSSVSSSSSSSLREAYIHCTASSDVSVHKVKNKNSGDSETSSLKPVSKPYPSSSSETESSIISRVESERRDLGSSSSSKSSLSVKRKDSKNGILRIEIVGLVLEKNSRIVKDNSIRYLLVDYFGFLDLEPECVETPQSLPKPKPGIKTFYNFMNEIILTKKERQMVEKLQKQDAEIQFHLSSEPQSDSQVDEDIELANASLKIRTMLKGYDGAVPLRELGSKNKIGTLFLKTSFET